MIVPNDISEGHKLSHPGNGHFREGCVLEGLEVGLVQEAEFLSNFQRLRHNLVSNPGVAADFSHVVLVQETNF
jgi:hypothetical protein